MLRLVWQVEVVQQGLIVTNILILAKIVSLLAVPALFRLITVSHVFLLCFYLMELAFLPALPQHMSPRINV